MGYPPTETDMLDTFKPEQAGCIDVGLQCGGWGKVVVELRVEEREGQ